MLTACQEQIITMKTDKNNAINITDWIKKQTSKGEIGTNIQSISNAIKEEN